MVDKPEHGDGRKNSSTLFRHTERNTVDNLILPSAMIFTRSGCFDGNGLELFVPYPGTI